MRPVRVWSRRVGPQTHFGEIGRNGGRGTSARSSRDAVEIVWITRYSRDRTFRQHRAESKLRHIGFEENDRPRLA